jgi:DNA polymerase-3 subunit gamma/tau
MAAQALYRKWRSQTFQELIGQEAVVRTLKNALQSGRIAHAYLFCGPRGTGKTTTARLLAKTVNCQHPQNGEPCNECLNCREITENRSLDVVEIDAASNRGIDEIRDLRDRVAIRPANSKYKVYVLDEAHMLTSEACNALLKTLEEPPPYVIFVLATTEAHRMLPTIVSRCQRFDFKRHTFRNTVQHLQYVAGQEGVTLESGAAELIARAAGGGMRDALSLLDQAMAAMGESVTQAGVQQMLGLADPHAVRELVEHIAHLRGADGLHLINRLAEAGADLRQLSAQVAEYVRAMMLARAGADIVAVLDRSPEEADEIRQLAELFALDELSACARLFSQNDVGARAITIPQLAVELAFIDCLHLHRQRTEEAGAATGGPASKPAASSSHRSASASAPDLRSTAASTQPAAVPPALPQASAAAPSAPSSASVQTIREAAAPAMREDPSAPTAAPAGEIEMLDLEAPPVVAAEAPFAASVVEDDAAAGAPAPLPAPPGLTLDVVTSQWELIKKACKTRTNRLAALLNDVSPVAVTGLDSFEVFLQAEYEFHYNKLLEPENRNVVEWALQEILQLPCRARFLQKHEPIPLSTTAAPATAAPGTARSPDTSGLQAAPRPTRPAHGAAPAGPSADSRPAHNGHGAFAVPPGTAGAAPASGPPANALETQVRQDPVVGEIIKTYGAKLVEWEPLPEDM